MGESIDKSKLKEKLTALQYHVTQEAGTERPFTGDLWNINVNLNLINKNLSCREIQQALRERNLCLRSLQSRAF